MEQRGKQMMNSKDAERLLVIGNSNFIKSVTTCFSVYNDTFSEIFESSMPEEWLKETIAEMDLPGDDIERLGFKLSDRALLKPAFERRLHRSKK